jgi:hypothetical protein
MKKILLALFATVCVSSGANAWSFQGHQIVAEIAERHLTPEALSAVRELLATEGKTKMSEVSSWADGVRQAPYLKYPNHTVRLPLDHSPYDPERDCKGDKCIIAGINADVRFLTKVRTAAQEAKLAALKYLVHLIGDIHQPLHATLDIGMRPVTLLGQKMNLHHVWDREIVRAHFSNLEQTCDEVEGLNPSIDSGGGVADWAEQSRDIARDYIFAELPDAEKEITTELPEEYVEEKWQIASLQLKLGGLRLASILNKIFQ